MANLKGLVLTFLIFSIFIVSANAAQPAGGDWTSFTLNNNNTRFQVNSTITSSNVNSLASKWNIFTGNSVTSTPVVYNGNVYFGDWGGYLWSANVLTGAVNWKINLGGGISSTPLIYNNTIYVGLGPDGTADIGHSVSNLKGINATAVFAVTLGGGVKWIDNLNKTTKMDAIWASPIVYKNILYIGVASQGDESESAWKGAIYGINPANGAMVWNALGTPNTLGYGSIILSGADGGDGVWGSVAINPNLNSIFFATGNPYGGANRPNTLNSLYGFAIISLNATTGHLNWGHQVYNLTHGVNNTPPYNGMIMCGEDSGNNVTTMKVTNGIATCVFNGKQDGAPQWTDDDFGSTPNLFALTPSSLANCTPGCNAVGVGNKDGNYYIVNSISGRLIERIQVGTSQQYYGNSDGGIIGVAGASNSTNPEIFADSFFLTSNGAVQGTVVAFYPSNGAIAWRYNTTGIPDGSVAVVPGAVLVGDINFNTGGGQLYAISTATGKSLFKTTLPGGMDGGVSVGEGYVFGTSLLSTSNSSLGLYAYAVPQPTSVTLALSNKLIDQGQSILFTASNVPTGGSTYTYNYLIVNPLSGAIEANMLSKSSSTTNSWMWTPPANLYTANTFEANVVVSFLSTTKISSYQPFGYNAALSPTISAVITPNINAGFTDTFIAKSNGGTGPYTYNYQIFNSITRAPLGNYLSPLVTQPSNDYAWPVPAADAGNTVFANVVITDHPTVPTTAASQNTFLTVTNVPNQTVMQMFARIQNDLFSNTLIFTNITNNQNIASTTGPAIMFFAYDSNALNAVPNVGENVLIFALPLGYEIKIPGSWNSTFPTVYNFNGPAPNTFITGNIIFKTIPQNGVGGGKSSGNGNFVNWKELVPGSPTPISLSSSSTSTSTTSTSSSTSTSSTSTSTSTSTSSTSTSTSSSTTSSSTSSTSTSTSTTTSTTTIAQTTIITVTTTINQLSIAPPVPTTQTIGTGNSATINDLGASGGIGPYTYQWLEQTPIASTFSNAIDCGANTQTTICTFSNSSLGTYLFELFANDSDTPPNSIISSTAKIVVVSTSTSTTSTSTTSIVPLAIAAPQPTTQNVLSGSSATISDSGASGGIGPYTYQWLEQTPIASTFSNAIDCGANTQTTICTFSNATLGTYIFELFANDSDTPPNGILSSTASINVVSSTTSTSTTTSSATTTVNVCSGSPQMAFVPNPAGPSSTVTVVVSGLSGCTGTTIQIKTYENCSTGTVLNSFVSGNTGGNTTITTPPGTGSFGYWTCVASGQSVKGTLIVSTATSTTTTSVTTTSSTSTSTTSTISNSCSGSILLTLSPNPANPASTVNATVSGLTNCAGQTVSIKDYQGCATGATIASFVSGASGGSTTFISQSAAGSYGYYACVQSMSSAKVSLKVS